MGRPLPLRQSNRKEIFSIHSILMVDRSMPRVCFHQTVSVSDHVLQPSQAFALFYQSLIFSGRNLATLKWISIHVGIPSGLELLMIDTNGDVMLDDALLHQRLCQAKRE